MSLVLIKPTSVTTSGTATIGTNGSVTFSGSTAYTINGMFSAVYRRYLIVCRVQTSTSAGDIQCDLSVGGTATGTASNYYLMSLENNSSAVTGTQASQIPYCIKSSNNSGFGCFKMDVAGPFIAGPTVARADFFTQYSSTIAQWNGIVNWHHSTATSYDGMRFFSGANFSGRLQVYGYIE